jgi:hypothetical protein
MEHNLPEAQEPFKAIYKATDVPHGPMFPRRIPIFLPATFAISHLNDYGFAANPVTLALTFREA